MIQPQLFDLVEILHPLPTTGQLVVGMQGTVVEQYDEQNFEIEFVNEQGETVALCALPRHHFVVVWQAQSQQAVSAADQLAQMMAHLSPTAEQEILDFARFVSLRQAPVRAD